MPRQQNRQGNGIQMQNYLNQAFMYALFLILMTLKLTGYIAWSWWAVTAPLWAPIAALILMFLAVVAVLGFKKARESIRST
jgi:membrane protein YdbS with pleckstrin-like domain